MIQEKDLYPQVFKNQAQQRDVLAWVKGEYDRFKSK